MAIGLARRIYSPAALDSCPKCDLLHSSESPACVFAPVGKLPLFPPVVATVT